MTTEQTQAQNPRCECGLVLLLVGDNYAACRKNWEPDGKKHRMLTAITPEMERAIRLASLPQAIPVAGIRATNVREQLDCLAVDAETCGVGIYCIDKHPGLWRRVSKSVKEAGFGGSLLLAATPTGKIWQFVRWDSLAEQLLEVLDRPEEDEEQTS